MDFDCWVRFAHCHQIPRLHFARGLCDMTFNQYTTISDFVDGQGASCRTVPPTTIYLLLVSLPYLDGRKRALAHPLRILLLENFKNRVHFHGGAARQGSDSDGCTRVLAVFSEDFDH